MERLGPQVLDRISKKSQMFCDEIDKVQREYINRKNNLEGSKEGEDRSQKSGDLEPGEENDADSSFQNLLYGP